MLPEEILNESFRIIDREVGHHGFTAEEWPIVRRMIHASGDLDLVKAVTFHRGAVQAGLEALHRGTPLVTDVNMVAAGIQRAGLAKLNLEVHCFIDDSEVRKQAEVQQTTRSYCAMKKALARYPEAVFVVGNAPTALVALCEAVRQKKALPALILALPVGFVGVLESKEQAVALGVPVIAVLGRKGGSGLAAAAVNALLLLAQEARPV